MYRLVTGKPDTDILTDFPPGKPLALRLAFKQVNDNKTALRITHCRSSRPAEWTEARRATPYPIPERRNADESFAARAFLTQRAQWTNTYPEDVPAAYRIFPDTAKHMSAPVVARAEDPIGVLTIETNSTSDYPRFHADALTLLAAHAYRPLKNAWERETALRLADFFDDEVTELLRETSDLSVLEAFSKRLKNLGYARGLFSSVDYDTQTINGRLAWGDAFEKVKEMTHRHFVKDADDCQVRAVMSGEPELVSQPETDKRAAADSKAVGHLRPFGIYPIKNQRGRVIWTIHLERHDTSRHNKTDEELINKLGVRFMRAWEEEQITQFERAWYKEMTRGSAFTVQDLLGRFADCIVDHGIVARCKVFEVSKHRRTQRLVYQAGNPRPKSGTVRLDERHHHIFNAENPALCYLLGHPTPLRSGDGFRIVSIPRDPHVNALNNQARTQWVEFPVRFAGQVVAKVVLDHVSEMPPGFSRTKARTSHAFSLPEMRMVTRIHHLLEAAARGLEASNTIAKLSAQGLHVRLLSHFCQHVLLCLRNSPPDADMKKEVDNAFESFKDFEAFFSRPCARQLSVGEILTHVKLACQDLGDDKRIDIEMNVPKASEVTQRIKRDELSLFLILVTLIENSISHLRKGADEQRIDVTALARDDGRLVLSVSDHGTEFRPRKKMR